jgi:hypothetical protein
MTRTELALTALYYYNAEIFQTWTMDVYAAEQELEETGEVPSDWDRWFYTAWETVPCQFRTFTTYGMPELVCDLLEELYTDNIHELSKNLWDFNEMVKGR